MALRAEPRDPKAQASLPDRIWNLIAEAKRLCDKEVEMRLTTLLEESFARYQRAWRESSDAEAVADEGRFKAAVSALESETLPLCYILRQYNSRNTWESEAAHRATVQWMAWALVALGVIGSLAGAVVGFRVAHGLRRSIYQLHIHMRDAADKLGQELAPVTLPEDGDLHVTLQAAGPEQPVLVQADPELLQQVLVNLALNALDVMPVGGTLTIEFRAVVDGQIQVRVLDTGPGIPPSLLPRLFEPFVSGKETGLGLGLAVSRRIIEEHGGSLEAHNRPEGGACFVLRLPVLVEACTPVNQSLD